MRNPPIGYPVRSYCPTCGNDFTGDDMFDSHRVGTHEYTFEEGLRMEPLRENGRRCRTEDEMREKGWRPLTEDEMRASNRDAARAGFGVSLWIDPARREHARQAFARSRAEARAERLLQKEWGPEEWEALPEP